MKATVCQLQDDPEDFACAWDRLIAHVQGESSQLVLLPEMPFCRWFAGAKEFRAGDWQAAVEAHEKWLKRLPELAPAMVLGSRPVHRGELRQNEGFIWTPAEGYQAVHRKYHLPNEVGFWEASWYSPGDGVFTPIRRGGLKVGVVICTDLWFLDRARQFGKQGIHILAHPRGTELATNDRWLVGGRAAAIVSGAYCLSSNRVTPPTGQQPFGGQGWIIDPDGEVLGLTSLQRPFLTLDIDLGRAEKAKYTYPRYAIA